MTQTPTSHVEEASQVTWAIEQLMSKAKVKGRDGSIFDTYDLILHAVQAISPQ